jgi:ATP-dependent DNA helicase RecQ
MASERALRVLKDTFGYPAFRGPQAQIIAHVESGQDALVLMPTGGGKSLCYQIPALVRNGVGIVVSPLIALMQDQVDALLACGVSAAFLNSSQSAQEAQITEARVRTGEVKLLYVAPERVMTERFLQLLDTLAAADQLALFAIDEAHCVSQWGHDFRAEYLQLGVLHERFPGVPRVALTATADALTRQEMRLRLAMDDAQEFVASFDRPNIFYAIAERVNEHKQLLAFLREHEGESGIVYCLSRKKVEATAQWLIEQGYAALPYHAGMDAETRRTNQSRFLREDGLVMVATIAFGMGIDKPDVRFVVHCDLPKSVESYYQETGRAGRDGEPSRALMLYSLSDLLMQTRFIEQSEAGDAFKRTARLKLDALLGLCETSACRRSRLLAYFGETLTVGCNACDNCVHPPQQWDATEPVRMALSAIYRTGQRFGAGAIIDVLRGKATALAQQRGHTQLPTFGVGKALSETQWRTILRQIVTRGWAQADATAFGALQLTQAARAVLRGEETVSLLKAEPVEPKTKPPRDKRTRAARGDRGARPAIETNIIDQTDAPANELFAALKAWRLDTARAHGLPAYVVLYDQTLREVALRKPQSLTELKSISGFGEVKINRYGSAILAIVRERAA